MPDAKAVGIDKLLGMNDKELQDVGVFEKSRLAHMLKQLKEVQDNLSAEDIEKTADAMKKLATIEEQIAAVEAKLAEARKNLGANSAQALVLERELEELRVKQFETSEEYVQFFSAIYSMTLKEAEEIGNSIKKNLVAQLAKGAINADKFTKSIKNVDAQLKKIRGKRNLLSSLRTGGIQGWINANLQNVEEGEYANAAAKVERAQKALIDAVKKGDMEHVAAAEKALKLAEEELEVATQRKNKWAEASESIKNMQQNIVYQIVVGWSEATDEFKKIMAETGEELELDPWFDDTMTAIGRFDQGLKQMASGNIFSGLISTVFGPIAGISKNHDDRREKKIQKSQKIVKALTVDYQNLQNAMESALGGVYTAGGYNEMLSDLNAQRAEIQRQYDIENSKKKSDGERLADYKQQLKELDEQIKNFALDMAKALYDIDLQSWASELGDALFEAWQKGEDGAEAFRDKVNEILSDLTKNILVKKVIETAMKPMENIITSEMERTGGMLDDRSLTAIAEEFGQIGMTLPQAVNTALDAYERGANQAGFSLKDDGSSKSSSAGSSIKGVTEQTADLLAGYINAIRADVSVNRVTLQQILIAVQVQSAMPVIARAQLTQLEQIAGNTNRNANAADAIYSLLHRLAPDGTSIRVK